MKDFTDYGFQDYYHSWWLWAEIKINFVRYDKNTAVKMDDVKYQCPWERKLIEQGGESYLPKVKRMRSDIKGGTAESKRKG